MKSKYVTWCHICKDEVDLDVEIVRCNGRWVHWGCRELIRAVFGT
jgi:hypothetical protein